MKRPSLSLIFALAVTLFPAFAEDWTTTDGKLYKDVAIVSHDSKVVTINSSAGMATFPIALLDTDLQKRVAGDNVTVKDWTVNGKDYHNVKVGKVEPDCVHIAYDGGTGTVMLSDLPADLQKRFNYDPKAAAQARQDRAAVQAQEESTLKEQASAKAAKAQQDLLAYIEANTKTIKEVETDQTAFKGTPFFIRGEVALPSFVEYGDMYPETAYYCFKLNDKTRDSAYAYGPKDSARAVKLRGELLAVEGTLKGCFLVEIDPARFYGNSDSLGLLLIDFYPPGPNETSVSPTSLPSEKTR